MSGNSLERRTFLGRAGMAGLALSAGAVTRLAGAGKESPELMELRSRLALYAGRVEVRRDCSGAGGDLHVVCEIADPGRFAERASDVAPVGVVVHAAGNVMSFEHNGRRVRVEHVWNA